MPEPIEHLAVGGEVFAYLERGEHDAPLVLCLHGFPDVPHSLLPMMEKLAGAGYRAVAPYLRGYAPSPQTGPFGPLPLGADALTLCSALAPGQRAYLVGHDWGAVATYVAASLAPNRIAAAVTMSVPHPAALVRNLARHPAQLARSSYMAAFQLPRLPERLLTTGRGAAVRWIWRLWSPGFSAPADLMREASACLVASMPAPLGHYRALRRPAQLRYLLAQSRPLKIPTLELHGARDRCIAPALGEGSAGDYAGPHARTIIAGAGHFLHVEAAEQAASAAIAWLGAHPT